MVVEQERKRTIRAPLTVQGRGFVYSALTADQLAVHLSMPSQAPQSDVSMPLIIMLLSVQSSLHREQLVWFLVTYGVDRCMRPRERWSTGMSTAAVHRRHAP